MTVLDPHAPNPMHHVSGPDDAWSTINTRENYSGVMSPLGVTLWLPISDLAVNGNFVDLGVLAPAEIRVAATPGESPSAVFYGRYTAGLNYFRRISDLVPGTSGAAFEEQIFGVVREGVADGSTRRRYPVIAAKAPLAVARLPRRARAMTRRMDTWWRRATSPEGVARSSAEQFAEATAMLEYAMRTHMTVSFVAQGLFDALATLATRAGRPGLHLELSTGYGQMVELELVAALDRVARGAATLAGFLAEYGFRCAGEVEMSNPSWRERPELVERLVAKYRAAPRPADLAARAAARTLVRRRAEHELLTALPRSRRPGARALLALAATFIPLREEGKAALARGFDGARAACGARGRELVEAGVIDQVDDVFYLTWDEIRGDPPVRARSLVVQRRELRAAYQRLDVPDHWIGPPVPFPAPGSARAGATGPAAGTDPAGAVGPGPAGPVGSGVLGSGVLGSGAVGGPGATGAGPVEDRRGRTVTGVAASSGVVQGPARVLVDAEECDELEPEEILVCRTTDPSWASAFHLVAGVVIDVGSTSSHGAIVAREMGLPCVIGTRDGTSALRTGDLVRVDGGAGVVTVLVPAGDGR